MSYNLKSFLLKNNSISNESLSFDPNDPKLSDEYLSLENENISLAIESLDQQNDNLERSVEIVSEIEESTTDDVRNEKLQRAYKLGLGLDKDTDAIELYDENVSTESNDENKQSTIKKIWEAIKAFVKSIWNKIVEISKKIINFFKRNNKSNKEKIRVIEQAPKEVKEVITIEFKEIKKLSPPQLAKLEEENKELKEEVILLTNEIKKEAPQLLLSSPKKEKEAVENSETKIDKEKIARMEKLCNTVVAFKDIFPKIGAFLDNPGKRNELVGEALPELKKAIEFKNRFVSNVIAITGGDEKKGKSKAFKMFQLAALLRGSDNSTTDIDAIVNSFKDYYENWLKNGATPDKTFRKDYHLDTNDVLVDEGGQNLSRYVMCQPMTSNVSKGTNDFDNFFKFKKINDPSGRLGKVSSITDFAELWSNYRDLLKDSEIYVNKLEYLETCKKDIEKFSEKIETTLTKGNENNSELDVEEFNKSFRKSIVEINKYIVADMKFMSESENARSAIISTFVNLVGAFKIDSLNLSDFS